MSTKTYRLGTGELVTSKDGEWPTQYVHRTGAEKAAAKIGGEVIQRGRPFYVRVPETEVRAGGVLTEVTSQQRAPVENPHVAPVHSWKVSNTAQGVVLTLNGISFALGTSRHAIIFDLTNITVEAD